MIATLLSSFLAAQPAAEPPQIRVTGRSVVSVEPERAEVRIGVVTEAGQAEEAARQNRERLDAVLTALRDALGPDAKIETETYSLHPVYRSPEPRGEPVPSGYSATNVVRLYDLPLGAVATAIDTATAAGANTVHSVEFSLRDESAAQARALREATADARSKAETLAAAIGARIVRTLQLSEGEADVIRPMPMYRGEMAMAQAAPPTPVEPRTIEVRASVTLVVEIEP